MKRMLPDRAQCVAADVKRRLGVPGGSRYERFLAVVTTPTGKRYGLVCTEEEFAKVRKKPGLKIELLWQPKVRKAAGEKVFSGIPTESRAARRVARADTAFE